jgi:rifampicin phosphotransferase
VKPIYLFSSTEVPTLEQAGGKALALVQMTGAGMPVPPGFVLTVEFFQPWTDALAQSPVWADLASPDAATIGRAARTLQTLCRGLELTVRQRQEMGDALSALGEGDHGQLYAVRSSSPEEDLEGASFAGGYETTLGVTCEGIEAAARHSFASSLAERVFLYKRRHGFRLDKPRIAVVVQRQVDAESSGVAFSLNPLNNCYDEAVINASHGLGESVVSGTADPDVFVVDKVRHEIIETRIGRKQAIVRLNPGGGTTSSSRAGDLAPCVTAAQVLELTRLLGRVEAYYRRPVDIEWAIAKGSLFLLQARPITAFLPLPEEMVTAPGAQKHLYADSTLIEQGIEEPLSVLGTDLVGYVLRQMSAPFGGDTTGLDGITFTAGGRYYMHLSHATKLGAGNAVLAPGSMGDVSVLAILKNIDMKQYLPAELPKKLRAIRGRMVFFAVPLLAQTMKAIRRPEAFLRRYGDALPRHRERFRVPEEDGRSLHEQATELMGLLHFFFIEFGLPMMAAAQIAQQRIKRLFGGEAVQVQDHLMSLGISLPGNKTAEMGEAMYALASSAAIARYESTEDFIADLRAGTLDPAFAEAWASFLREFGARCPREIDVATPRLDEQPALLFRQLKSMSPTTRGTVGPRRFFEEARAKREAAYLALVDIARKKGKRAARLLERNYAIWITLGGFRETPKHYVITVIDLLRRRALSIGRLLAGERRLDAPEQIFDLTVADVDRAMADPTLDLRALARKHTAAVDRIRKSHVVARVIDSRGKVYHPLREASADGVLEGVPISPGVARGRVKVLRHATEKELLPGEILVARVTDPGWTPLFINAGGIVLEIGGALQHGAVVAREYGIPCVSGLEDATSRLQDGQLVEVDGTQGQVHLLEGAGSPPRP